MKRDYKSGVSDTPILFVGTEVEKLAYGMKTLFVDGVQDIENIMYYYAKQKCEHIFFGANLSFNPGINSMVMSGTMGKTIKEFLKEGFYVLIYLLPTMQKSF